MWAERNLKVSESVILFRAKCIASQKKLKYRVYVAIQRKSGTCLSGNCDCPQGLPGNCSHVCGLLLALEYINRTKNQNPGDISCTSQLCKWRKPRSVKVSPKPLNEIAIYKPTYGKEPKKPKTSSHDLRAPKDRLPDMQQVHTQLKVPAWVELYYILNNTVKVDSALFAVYSIDCF